MLCLVSPFFAVSSFVKQQTYTKELLWNFIRANPFLMRYLTYLSCSSLEQRYISWYSLCFKVKFAYPNIVIPILSVFCSFHFHPATPNEKSSTMFLKLPKNYDVSFFPPQLLNLSIIIIIIITIIIIVHCQWLPLLIFRVRAKACPAGNCQSRQGLVLASRLTHPAIYLSQLQLASTKTKTKASS